MSEPRLPIAPRVATWIVLLAAPLSFLFLCATDAGPVWRAHYQASEPGVLDVELLERQVSHVWGRRDESVPGELDAKGLRVQWDTCVYLEESRDIPLQLVVEGEATLSISGNTELTVHSPSAREAHGKIVHFAPGWHQVHIDFIAGKHPSIALNASLDGRAPRALGSAGRAAGFRAKAPQSGADVCPKSGR